MNAAFTWLSAWLFDFAALATVLLAAALAARRLVRRPAERMTVAWSVWLGLAALAVIAALPQWPRMSVGASRRVHGATIDRIQVLPLTEMHGVESLVVSDEPLSPSAVTVVDAKAHFAALVYPALASWRFAMVLAWLGSCCVGLAWIVLGIGQTWRLLRCSTTAPAWIARELSRLVGKQRLPGLRLSREIASAAAVGAIRPRIVLPAAAADEAHAAAVRAALAHEWAHIRHGDLWLLALERLLIPLLGWHPLFWILRRGVRLDLELLADAAAAGDRPIEYAEALVVWAKSAGRAPLGVAALSLWESPHTLSRRIAMLVDPNRCAGVSASRGWQVAIAAALLALIGGLSVVSFEPLTADEPPQAHTEKPIGAQVPLRDQQRLGLENTASGETQVKVFAVQGGDASARADMLRGVLGEGSSVTRPLRISADPRTNSIIAVGSGDDLEVIRGILDRLERPGAGVPRLPPVGATIPPPPVGRVATLPAIPVLPIAARGLQIQLSCATLEVDTDELLKALPEINDSPQPSPVLAVLSQPNEKWQSVLEKLQAVGGTKLISRPKLVTHDRQSLEMQIAAALNSAEEQPTCSISLTVHPQIAVGHSPDAKILLGVECKLAELQPAVEPGGDPDEARPREKIIRSFATGAAVEPKKTLILVDRSTPKRAFVIAIEPQVLQAPSSTPAQNQSLNRNALRGRLQSVEQRLEEDATAAVHPSDAALRQELLRLRQEIDRLLGNKQADELEMKAMKTRKVEGQLKAAQKSLSAVQQQLAKENSNFSRQERARLEADAARLRPQVNALSEQLKLIKEYETTEATGIPSQRSRTQNAAPDPAPAARSRFVPSSPAPYPTPATEEEARSQNLARAAAERRAQRETQIKLMELDLTDAELEVQVAQAELDSVEEMRKVNPQALSRAEITKREVAVRRAQLRVEKIKVMLDGMKREERGERGSNQSNSSGDPSPATARPT